MDLTYHLSVFPTKSKLQTTKLKYNVQLPKSYLPLFKYVEQTSHGLEPRQMPKVCPRSTQRLRECGYMAIIRPQIPFPPLEKCMQTLSESLAL